MNSRERVLAALNHKQPDKVPVDLGGHRSSNFSAVAYKNLRDYLGLPKKPIYVYDVIQQLAVPGEDVLDMFGVDVIDLGRDFTLDDSYWKDFTQQDGTEVKIPAFADLRREGGDTYMYNTGGVAIAVQKEGCLYFEQTVFPREDNDSDDFSGLPQDLDKVMWFSVGSPPAPLGYGGADMRKRQELAKALRSKSDRAIYGGFGGNFYESAQFTFRIDNAMMNFAAEPRMMHKFLDAMLEIHLVIVDKFLEACGDEIDVLGVGDDLGMQSGPQISPDMYREFLKPRQSALWGHIKKANPRIKLCLHSCGGIEPLLPDIIDAGMDAVNPVQITCAGMDPASLKQKYGKDITFWGGGCDTRDILPNASPQEVKDHVKRNLDIWFHDGGYVFQQVHNIMANVPPQNIVAMFEAVAEYS